VLAGAAMATAAPAYAQDDDVDSDDVVIVTGSRLQTNPNLAAANPVLSVTDEEIDLRGTVRIEDLTNILPQVFAAQAGEVSNAATGTAQLDLRGLGAIRTLVLIDGKRLPYGDSQTSAANLDIIPSQLVERVDILTGGASAVYGSDAVAGVANFVLKRDFEGVQLDILGGIAQNSNGVELSDNILRAASQPVPDGSWDGEELNLSLTLGANTPDGRGNVTLFAAYETREAITQDNRSVSGCALGQDDGPQSFAGLGCVGSANFRLFGGSGGFAFQQLDGTITPFMGGPAETYNFGPRNFFQRPSERFQIFARGHYEIAENLEAFADLAFINNNSDAQIAETASFGIGAYSINCDNPLIQTPGLNLATDIFGCTAADIAAGNDVSGITASHRNVEGGPRNSALENTAWRMVSGLRGNFAEHWDWEAFVQYSRTQDVDISENDFVIANLQDAFFAVDDGMGNVVCRSGNAGCVPYNPFQRNADGTTAITSAQTDYIQGVGITTGETSQLVIGANVQADLGNFGISSPLSDNGVGFLVGIEYRDDDLNAVPDEISQVPGGGFTGVGGATLPVAGSLDVFELYTELQVPIITGRQFFEELVFNGQYRFSDYTSDGNGVTNTFDTHAFGLQLSWAPIEDVKFRGQFQRAVRAPNVIELFTGQNTNLPNLNPAGTNSLGTQLFDPCASAAPIASLAQCMNTGVTAAQFGTILDVISGQTQSITGGNPLLDPESSDTYSFGVVVTPQAFPGFSLSIDYFDITVEDYISAGIPAQTTLDNCLTTGDPAFCSLITRSPAGSLAAGGPGVGFLQTNINIAELSTKGIDLQVLYRTDIGDMGALRFDYAATYLDEMNFIPFPGGAPIVCAGQFGNNCGDVISPVNPNYRHRLLSTWSTPWDLDMTLTWRFISSVSNDNPNETLETELETQQYLDVSMNFPVSENVKLRGGVLNVLNNQPPIFSGAGPALGNGNTYPVTYDTGRFLFGGVTLTF
jgi:outer membrane receptor protein involved in Fe transport